MNQALQVLRDRQDLQDLQDLQAPLVPSLPFLPLVRFNLKLVQGVMPNLVQNIRNTTVCCTRMASSR